MKKTVEKLFNRDFALVVIGQIISLFGNAILRFALPLYLLRQTGSASLFGVVTATSFLPMIVLSMIGGILADRVNKRNIMVILDFMTALIIVIFSFFINTLPTVPLFICVLMLLYGISGTYQPSVQASIPLLVPQEKLIKGNAVISQVNTLSNLLGPVIGGMVFGTWGITPILIASIICFSSSAIMEIFIFIPFNKKSNDNGVFALAAGDLKESYLFVKEEKPIFFSILRIVSSFNFILTAAIIVGIPILIIQTLNMSDAKLGFAQGILALGGLFGGFVVAVLSKKLSLKRAYKMLGICSGCVGIMGLSLFLNLPSTISYFVITAMCFFTMSSATVFTIQIFTMVQQQTPPHLIGKIMATLITVAMCAQPLGQALYGVLFDIFKSNSWIILFGVAVCAFFITLYSKNVFLKLEDNIFKGEKF